MGMVRVWSVECGVISSSNLSAALVLLAVGLSLLLGRQTNSALPTKGATAAVTPTSVTVPATQHAAIAAEPLTTQAAAAATLRPAEPSETTKPAEPSYAPSSQAKEQTQEKTQEQHKEKTQEPTEKQTQQQTEARTQPLTQPLTEPLTESLTVTGEPAKRTAGRDFRSAFTTAAVSPFCWTCRRS